MKKTEENPIEDLKDTLMALSKVMNLELKDQYKKIKNLKTDLPNIAENYIRMEHQDSGKKVETPNMEFDANAMGNFANQVNNHHKAFSDMIAKTQSSLKTFDEEISDKMDMTAELREKLDEALGTKLDKEAEEFINSEDEETADDILNELREKLNGRSME